MPWPAYRWAAERRARGLLWPSLTRDYPRAAERVAGLSDGAGVGLASVCLFHALEPLLSSVGGQTARVEACPGACSAVAIRGAKSADGSPLVARNFDYLPLVQPLYTLRDCRPSGGLRSLEFTTAPLAGAVDGMNEAGLCITYDYAFATDGPSGSTAPISLAISEALERCRTVNEAAEFIAGRPRWGGALLMLADAAGDLASLELSSGRSFLRRASAGEDWLFHTNAFSSEAMRAVQIPADAVYTDRAPAPLRGRRFHLSSESRDRRLNELLARSGPLSRDDLAGLMSDHGQDGVPGDYTPCVHGSYWHTTACLQFQPRDRRMRVSYSTACQARYVEFGL